MVRQICLTPIPPCNVHKIPPPPPMIGLKGRIVKMKLRFYRQKKALLASISNVNNEQSSTDTTSSSIPDTAIDFCSNTNSPINTEQSTSTPVK